MKSFWRVALLGNLLFALLVFWGCGSQSSPGPSPQAGPVASSPDSPAIVYATSEVPWPDLSRYVAAQNKQLQNEFKAHWSINALVVMGPPKQAGDLELRIIADFSRFTQQYGAVVASYHGVNLRPVAYCNWSVTGPEGSTSSTCSHEVLEMLMGQPSVCDPVAPYAYLSEGMEVANFVHPIAVQNGQCCFGHCWMWGRVLSRSAASSGSG